MNLSDQIGVEGRICLAFFDSRGQMKRVSRRRNLVTTAGLDYYAERMADTQPSAVFTNGSSRAFTGKVELYNGVTVAPSSGANRSTLTGNGGVVLAASLKAVTAGYPRLDDQNTANPDRGPKVLTYLFDFGQSDAVGTFTDIVITIESPLAASPLLMWSQAAPDAKTGLETMKLFVNHNTAAV